MWRRPRGSPAWASPGRCFASRGDCPRRSTTRRSPNRPATVSEAAMGHFRQELDHSRNPLLATVLAVTLLVFLLGTVWGYAILMRKLDALAAIGPKALPPEANGIEVGRVIHW